MPIYSNFYQTLTTACPIVELRGYAAACGLKGHLYAYLDFNGPTGTARDGLAEGMLALAIEKKQLAPGQPIIEAASGPFATALTLASLTAGHPIVLVMPEDAPALRQEYLLRLGAQIRHSPARSGLAGARALAAQTAAANGWYYMNWLANDDNPEYHRRASWRWSRMKIRCWAAGLPAPTASRISATASYRKTTTAMWWITFPP